MKQPTIVDVAERAGVSKSLVSLVMRDSNRVSQKSRSAVLEAARELGYRPNAAALGALDAIDEAGLQVPEDISVVGYDDSALSHIRRIALTTVAQPSVEIGRTAVRLLIERIQEGRSDPRHIVLPPQLVVRGTSATPRV